MAHSRLSSPDQPIAVRLPLRLYEALASMPLAVVLLVSITAVLAWATFIESDYGAEAVHFAIYDAWWFAGLLGLLGVNVLCAALIRFPWRRYQTGFVMTHAGILVLLAGCIHSAISAIDAQMPVLEGGTGHVAYEKTRHFQIKIFPDQSGDGTVSVIDIPFASGPFNWEDYETVVRSDGEEVRPLGSLCWHIARRDRGVICDQDGIKLEVLDFHRIGTDRPVEAFNVRVAVSDPATGKLGAWATLDLNRKMLESMSMARIRSTGVQERLENGGRILFKVAAGVAETEAFSTAMPEGPLGEAGQIVLYVRGQVFRFQVDELSPGQRLELGDTGYEAEFVRQVPSFLGVDLLIHPPLRQAAESMRLFAEMPELDTQAVRHAVYGSYWVDPASPTATEAATMLGVSNEPRIEILQDTDGGLLYRVWQAPTLEGGGEIELEKRIEVKSAASGQLTRFYVDQFEPHDHPGMRFVSRPFDKETAKRSVPLVRVRLTVDGMSEQFWLQEWQAPVLKPRPDEPISPLRQRVVAGDGRRVELMLRPDSVDLGMHVYLEKFQRKLDPGSRNMVSHYSSLIDFVTVRTDPRTNRDVVDEVLEEKVLITLNEPITRVDPTTGRSFRLYQESYAGPWKPGSPIYDAHLGGRVLRGEELPRDELYQSTLTVNCDPGRGLKYFGCLMIVVGIAAIFYMKAYFLQRRRRDELGSTAASTN